MEIAPGVIKQLPEFTLVGATTNPAKISEPLQTRFPVVCALDEYTEEELTTMAHSKSDRLSPGAAHAIATMSGGTPRNIKTLIQVLSTRLSGTIEREEVLSIGREIGISESGLREQHYAYIEVLGRLGHSSLSTIASAMHADERTVTDMIEPVLIRKGIVQKTSRGRSLTGVKP